MNLRRQAAQALGDAIHAYAQLREKPVVISAPPSEVSDYPRVAIWLEHFSRNYSQSEDLEVDANGDLLVGASRTLTQGAGPATIQSGVRLSCVGTLKGSGRIWVGCRLPAKREEVEDSVGLAFVQDGMSPGRLLLAIDKPRVAQYVIPWKWTCAAFLEDSDWTNEFAFSERLWAWVKFELEVSILVPRHDPLVKRFLLDLDVDVNQPYDETGTVQDLDGGADTVTETITTGN